MPRWLIVSLFLTFSWPALAQVPRQEQPSAAPLQDRAFPMEVTVNGIKAGTWTFVDRRGDLHVGRDAFEEWRVQVPATAEPITYRGQPYWPLAAVPGFVVKNNPAAQSADLTFAPEAFFSTRLSRELTLPKPSPVLPSVFLNYDLNLQTIAPRGARASTEFGALLESGWSTGLGVLTNSVVGRNLAGSTDATRGWTRLETTFTRNDPASATTLRLGDAAVRPGLWGSSVYFGGVQLAKDFSLQPGFLTQPVPVFTGVSAAPSTVQLYVNDVLRRVSDVPPGPFVIDNLAGLSGAGEARVVVRDILGREVVITQQYFTSAQLLAAGLSDWSVEAGALRSNLGFRSADYGSGFAAGTWRYGWSDRWTVEARAEASQDGQTAGVGAIAGLPFDALARMAVSTSRHAGVGDGSKLTIGIERQWTTASAFFQVQTAGPQYRELGRTAQSARLEWTANANVQVSSTGRVGMSIAGLRQFAGPEISTASLSYQVALPQRASLVVSLSRAWGNGSGTFAGASLSLPLDGSLSMQAAASAQGGRQDLYASVNQTSTGDVDAGWRLLSGRFQGETRAEGGAFYGGRYGRVYSDLSTSSSQSTLRSGATGGLVVAASRLFVSKRVDQSFAVVEIKDQDDVGVGLGSAVSSRTDSQGIALIPYLTAYQPNQVRLNAADLPISAEVESLEQVVVPSWRSAVKVDFPIRAGRAALVRIELEDGAPAPPGATVRITGDKETFYVARRGEAYVTGLLPGAELTLDWSGRSCRLPIVLPPAANDDIIRLGPVRCAGVVR